MSTACAGPIADLAALLSYPQPGFHARLDEARRRLTVSAPEAAKALEPFAAFAAQRSETELEEAYTQTFDLNPDCALEIGWHLYGEDYKRGEFLVELRRVMRRLDVPEGTELPDHLPHILEIIDRLEGKEASVLAREKLLPAMKKMSTACAEHPYGAVLRAIEVFFEVRFASPSEGEKA